MGQVVDFMAFKRAKHDDKFQEIKRLEQAIMECEGKLLYSPYVNVREDAAIKALEYKMQIVAINQSLGIMK